MTAGPTGPAAPVEPPIGGALLAPYSALVVTASNRAAAGVYEDREGP